MSRRTSLLVVGSAVGCSFLLVCIFVAAMAGYTYLSPAIAATVNRIAYVDNDGNIQIVDARGEHRVALTTDASATGPRAYLFPTWAPDSRRVAFVGVGGESNAREVALYSEPAVGGKPATVFKSTTQAPFYLYWSPDSQWIGFLAGANDELALMLGRGDAAVDARELETGLPLYWAWSSDSRTMLVHVGGSARDAQDARLALRQRDSAGPAQALKPAPADFQAPHYSPDGSTLLFAATSSTADDALYLADAQGGNVRSIAAYRGSIAFAWSPDGKKIASLVTPEDAGLPFYGPVWVSDADGSNRKQVTEQALAFYWSPDSRQIAFLTPALQSQGQGCIDCGNSRAPAVPQLQGQNELRVNWRLVSLADGHTRTLATFARTRDFFSLLPNFDQYARSLTFWSPDSQHFVYTQSEGSDTGSVWVADVAANAEPRRVGDGTFAAWSWR